MSHSHRHHPPRHATRAERRAAGRQVAGAAVLVLAALLLAPWLAGRITPWRPAPAVAIFVTLAPALYVWFRRVQQTRPRTAAVLALVYAALAALILWALRAP